MDGYSRRRRKDSRALDAVRRTKTSSRAAHGAACWATEANREDATGLPPANYSTPTRRRAGGGRCASWRTWRSRTSRYAETNITPKDTTLAASQASALAGRLQPSAGRRVEVGLGDRNSDQPLAGSDGRGPRSKALLEIRRALRWPRRKPATWRISSRTLAKEVLAGGRREARERAEQVAAMKAGDVQVDSLVIARHARARLRRRRHRLDGRREHGHVQGGSPSPRTRAASTSS